MIKKLIPQKRRVGIATRTAFERVTLVLEGVSRARETLLQSSSRSHEAAEWEALLNSAKLRNDMVRLLRDSHRTPGTDELHQVLNILRKGFQREDEPTDVGELGIDRSTITSRRRLADRHRHTASADRIGHNMVLDLISRIAQQPTLRNAGRNSDQRFAHETITTRMVQELPLRRLVTSILPRQETSNSLEDMSQLYYTLWYDMSAFDDLAPDAFAWSTRLRLEGKVMLQELFAALGDLRSDLAVRSLDEVWDKSLTFKGWATIQASLKKALTTNSLHSSHIHQVLWLYCHARLEVRRATAKSSEGILSAVMNRFFRFDADAVDVVSELYETMRWNEVRMEMDKLRMSRSNDGAKSPSSFASMLAGGTNGAEEKGGSTFDGPVATLLGIPIPDRMVPVDITYSMLIRYYAAVEGDYSKACEVLEDFKQAGHETMGSPSPTSTSTPAPRQPSMVILDSFFRAFAVHGVASEEGEDGHWYIAAAPPLASASTSAAPVSGWRLENLLAFLDALLHRPAPNFESRRSEQEKYGRISSMLSADSASQEGEEDDALQALLFPNSNSTSSTALATAATSGRAQAQAPSPRQLFTVLTALRRCTGDARPDHVLRYWRALEAKYGLPAEEKQQGEVGAAAQGKAAAKAEAEVKAETEAEAGELAQVAAKRAEPAAAAAADSAATQQVAEQGASPELKREREGDGEEKRGAGDDSGVHRLERANEEGWIGWRLDNRLKRLLPFLEEQTDEMRRERGRGLGQDRERGEEEEEEEEML